MWVHEIPADVATEIYGTIECVLTDHLQVVVREVEAASRVTVRELVNRFHRQR